MMTFKILFLAVLVVATGLEVGPVRLLNNVTYLSYNLGAASNYSVLECPYQLSEGEDLQKITWVIWNDEEQAGTYEWFSSGGEGTATGLLKDVVNLSREDGDLELTKLRYDLGGFYSCAATLTYGQVKEATKWEALIIDIPWAHSYHEFGDDPETCTYHSSIQTYAVYPPPTVSSGMYSDELGGYFDKVTSREWLKIVYANKSTAYSYTDRVFKIDANMPDDAVLKFMIGVTKTDGTYIALSSSTTSSPFLLSKGCPIPWLEEHQVLYHTPARKNCRNQLEQISSSTPIKAEVSCEQGYHAEGEVTIVKMECNETFVWIAENGGEPRVEDLQCIIDTTPPGGHGGAGDDRRCAALVVAMLLLLCLLQQ